MKEQFIGYFLKRIVWQDELLARDRPVSISPEALTRQVCSVSRCISAGPDGWRERRRHNVLEMYDTQELAWRVVPARRRDEYELFAYTLYLVEFVDGRSGPIEAWWDLDCEPMPASYIRLGWDAVVGGNGHGFGCSPLSCNGQAGLPGLPPINRHYLLSTRKDAFELARTFSITKPEPGPYCVVKVWRQATAGA